MKLTQLSSILRISLWFCIF